MSKKLIIVTILISLLAISAAAVYAQGNGNSNGNGANGANGNGGNGVQQNLQIHATDPAYTSGGIGFVNPQNGNMWNGSQRGQMNRGAGMNGTGFYASLPPATVDELPQNVIDLVIDGWTDEQHALAVYESVIAQFGEVAPFVNIMQAELQHAAAWELMFDRYGIEVPAIPTFDVPQFASVEEACALGAEAEIANFGLYDTMLTTFEDYPDLYQVALSLRNASEFQHLPAFQSCSGS